MPIFDLALEELREYRPDLTKRDDFDAFWAETLAKARQQPLEPTVEAVSYPVPEIRAFAATYRGWQGGTVGGWYLLPHGEQPFPAMIFYHGYSNTKQGIYNYLPWVLQGYAVLAVDVRDQPGASTDPGNYSAGHSPGWMTKGILDKQEYYYRGVYVDSVRALDFLDAQGNADMSKVGLAGFSQGGGLSLAVAALDDRPALSMPQMPFLCHFERPLDISQEFPYWEFAEYIRHHPDRAVQMFETLSYFDNMNLAERISCPVLCSVGLIDEICPPSTIFAAYNRITSEKHMAVFPYHEHERPYTHEHTLMHWANHFLRGVAERPEELG